jgi:primosomal protein N' (replication factor Y) (superfamily II helicase)
MSQLYVDLAIPVAVNKLFTYSVPNELHHVVKCGARAIAPFGKRTVIGIIANITTTTHAPYVKPIQDVIDLEPVLSDEMLNLTKWMAEYYFTPWGEVIKAVLVQGAMRAGKRVVCLANPNIEEILETLSSAPVQFNIIEELTKRDTIHMAQLQKKIGTKSIYAALSDLVRQGFITVEEESSVPKLKPKFETVIEISEDSKCYMQQWVDETVPAGKKSQIKAVRSLLSLGASSIALSQFLKQTGLSFSTVRILEKKKVVKTVQREVIRSTEYDLYPSSLGAQDIVLNTYQQMALKEIVIALEQAIFQPFLLHGVTGSGKTQVYIEAIRSVLARGKTAIVLVPEISLTPQIVRRFKFHFGEKVIALHSRMSPGERYDVWRLTHEGKYSIVIGPRSAVFAPLKNIGLIVVDEEQESSYKQFDQTPRYHARDVAVVRASLDKCVVVLGSATPSFESYANAQSGKYKLLELPERVDNAELPQIEIVDMTAERRKELTVFRDERKAEFKTDPVKARAEKKKFEFGSISDLLKEKIGDRLQKKEGIILLQNRRGFSPFIECPDCGYVEMCENCNISLTYHLIKRHLRCHYCGFVREPPVGCPKCHGIDIQYRGFGTQRVEEELTELFPNVRMIRMDLDTTSRKGSHDVMLRKFSDGDVDILLGTQMVAKGLDFSRVTLVGVISADTQMLLPDFRSAERTFQLLTQVAGRAGRSALPGEVIIQTYQPQHYSLSHVLTHDFKSFYREELEYREELAYPPFSRVVLIEFKGKKETEVMRHATKLAELLRQHSSHFVTLGPASAVIAKIRNMFRWHIVIKDLKSKDTSGQQLHHALKNVLQAYRSSAIGKSRLVQVIVDVDPVGMM